MQRYYSNTNVDLSLLIKRIEGFFEENGFETVTNKTENGYQLLAYDSPYYAVNGTVEMIVIGTPQEFSISFELQRKSKSKIFSLQYQLMALFGGGYAVIQEFKADEAWIDLKRDFWQETDRAVTSLTGSASNSESQP